LNGGYLDREHPFQLPCVDPQFLRHLFLHQLQAQQEHPFSQLFDLRNEARLSFLFDLSKVQESGQFRALNRARRLAQALIDERGELRKDLLQHILSLFEKEGYIFYPFEKNDGIFSEHLHRFLRVLSGEDVSKSLKRFQGPLAHSWAETLVFRTLGIEGAAAASKAQIRSAVLCACMTPLNQNVGSCFATAPAKLIQSEQVPLLLDDLYQLLTTGKLKRTFGGIEYSVPLSPSTGIGDLKKILPQDPKKASYSPGLIAALGKADLIPPSLPLEEQAKTVQALIHKFSSGRSPLTAESLIHNALLHAFSLRKEDLKEGNRGAKVSFHTPGSQVVQRLERLSSFHHKERECREAFKGVCTNALLKAWEFTIASFSEVKMEFSKWNLYLSLGLAAEEAGGIGEIIYQRVDEKIKQINEKLQEYQTHYENAFDQVRSTEALLRNASSDLEVRRLQAEYQSHAYHMRSCLELRDEMYTTGSHYSQLLPFLASQYNEKFPEYFQEIYDAEMQDLQGGLYDDSPAGFRLVYKHGRVDPALWTLIYDAEHYIESLISFFTATESSIAAACEWKGGEQEVLEITSAIVSHIRKPIFLETAFQRMAKGHLSLRSYSQTMEKKPWAYTSGGTMTTLVKTYYCREGELTQEEKWVENESELLIFLLDTLKNLPPKITNPYMKQAHKGMLMTSPTHAFVLLPGQEELLKGWSENLFTYTWVRDEILLPSQQFYAQMHLLPSEQIFLFNKFCEQLPSPLSHALAPQEKSLFPSEWRNELLSKLASTAQRLSLSAELDAFLYQMLPLTSGKEWKQVIRRSLADLLDDEIEQVLALFPNVPAPFLTARDMREIMQGCYLLAKKTLFHPLDLHQAVAKRARATGITQPSSLLFADTNWIGNYFGFVVNPGTNRLELWRLDRTLSQGTPMSDWQRFLNGSERKTWSIFTHPHEYEKSTTAQLRV
jgi:hypothetical protein